jgi:glutathione S-transferase
MLYLYHGTTSVCAIKVRLTIAEKALPWRGEVLWLQRGDQYRPDYLRLNPNAVVPTLVHDGKVIIESKLIMEYLDETFSDIPLMPSDSYARSQVRPVAQAGRRITCSLRHNHRRGGVPSLFHASDSGRP